jgi:zinc transporter 1/2/3
LLSQIPSFIPFAQPYALGLCLLSILSIFVVEITTTAAYRAKSGTPQGAEAEFSLASHPNSTRADIPLDASERVESSRVVGIIILEFGAILHRYVLHSVLCDGAPDARYSVLIGLTLAADPKFKVLFAVIVTHRA